MPEPLKRLDRIWALALLALVAVTWRLWIPRGDALEVPMISGLTITGLSSLSRLASWLPLLAMIASAIVILLLGNRRMWWIVAASLVVAFAMNQHRIQPWAYQSAIYALAFASMDHRNAAKWLRPLAASIYLYSAAGKFDFQFSHTVGQQFLETVMSVFGGVPDSWTLSTRANVTMLFPAGELIVGIGLLVPQTRRIAGWLAMLFHVVLLQVLGPWGLNHSNGVLVWNIVLIFQAYVLFVQPEPDDAEVTIGRGSIIAKVAIVIALVMPLGERSGRWDHWTSWALYSPHSSRVRVEVHDSAIEKLDSDASRFCTKANGDNRWRELSMDQWSLQTIGVPVYPQARFQLAVADRLAVGGDLRDAIRVIIMGPSDRRSGTRSEKRLLGAKEIHDELNRYWLVGADSNAGAKRSESLP